MTRGTDSLTPDAPVEFKPPKVEPPGGPQWSVILRRLIVAEIALSALYAVVVGAQDAFLPPALREYEESRAAAALTLHDGIMLAIAVPGLALLMISWVALWRDWRSGRLLYTIAWASGLAVAFLGGPVVETAIGKALDTTASVVGGLTLGLLYFSDLRWRYIGAKIAR
jgi:hypothetical protein